MAAAGENEDFSARFRQHDTGSRRTEILRLLVERSEQSAAAQILERLDGINAVGHEMAPSEVAGGLTDLSCPVLDQHGNAVAAPPMPCPRCAPPGRRYPAALAASQ